MAEDAEPDTGWSSKTIGLAYHGNAIRKKERGVGYKAESLYSGNATTKGNVAFACYTGNFGVNIAIDAVDLGTLIANPPESTQRKAKRLTMTVDGEEMKSQVWVYMPKMGVYRARTQLAAAKVYNAVILGQDVAIKAPGKDNLVLNLPALDDEFQDFGAGCGMGRKAKK